MLQNLAQKCLVTTLLLVSLHSLSQTQLSPRYSVDGTVQAIVNSGDSLIIGGNFGWAGIHTAAGALLTTSSDLPDAAFPKMFGSVSASTPDGNGGYYIAGVFSKEFNGASFQRIEHVLSNYSYDPNFSVTVSSLYGVQKLLLSNGLLYIGGSYVDHINGAVAGDLAAIDVVTSQLASWIPAVNIRYLGGVYGLYISQNTLYISGSFDFVGGVARSNIAAIQIGTGTVKPWNFAANWADPKSFTDVEFYNNSMFISGNFDDGAAPNARGHACAKTDTITGTTVNYVFYSSGLFGADIQSLYFGASISSLAISGDTLFAFSNGTFDTRVVAVNLLAGNNVIWARYFNIIAGPVEMKTSGGALFVAGNNFTEIYQTNLSNDNVANLDRKIRGAIKLNNANGSLFNWFPDPRPVGAVTTMSIYSNKAFIGGSFQYLKAQEKPHIVMIRASADTILPFISTLTYSNINALKIKDSVLYAAGDILYINNVFSQRSAVAYHLTTGNILPWAPPYLGNALCIEAGRDYVFLGGLLTESGGAGRTNLFAINRSNAALATWAPNPNNAVHALHIHNGFLYVGGGFTNAGGAVRNHLAAFDTTGLVLSGWDPHPNLQVNTITADNNIIWVGGNFYTIGDSACNLFAGVHYLTGSVQRIPSTSLSGSVNAFKKMGCYLIAGGNFLINSTACNNLVMYNMFDRSVVPSSSFCVNIDNLGGNVKALGSVETDLYFGGAFTKVNNTANSTNIERVRFPLSALAGCADYISVQNGAWNNPATWLGGAVPPANAKVIVLHTVTVTQNAVCFSLHTYAGGSVTVQAGVNFTVVN